MTTRLHLVALTVLLCGAGPIRAQADLSEVQMKTIHVAGPVYMLVGSGGNLGVSAGPDGVLLIDDQFAPLSEKILAAVERISPNPLRFVLNTHWHHDHTGGNEVFGRRAPVLAHANVRRRLMTGGSSLLSLREREAPPVGPASLPLLTYEDGVTLHMNGETIDVIHLPHAHTDGDSVVIFRGSHVAHVGDLLFSGKFPYVDLGSGGSVQGLLGHVEWLLSTLPEDTQIIPGHGPLSSVQDLQRYHEMLVETTGLVRQRVDAEQTEDQAVAMGLPERWQGWGDGFINEERWIRTIYRAFR